MGKREFTPEQKAARNSAAIQWRKNNPERYAELQRRSREKHKEKRNAEALARYYANPDLYNEKNKLWHLNNPEKASARAKRYKSENWHKIRQQKKERYDSDPVYRLSVCLRTRLVSGFRKARVSKSNRTFALTGCTLAELVDYLSSQFQPGMTLENFGEWVIDHKTPLCKFDLTDPIQEKEAFHYTNLQPLWWIDNLRKFDNPDYQPPIRDSAPSYEENPAPILRRKKAAA